MFVVPIASTYLHLTDDNLMAYRIHYDGSTGIDQLAEVAGRTCYKSFDRPNPKTATNESYIKNIIDQGHFSVMEHGSVTFYVEGVSRALLTELERHRFLSFSVVSQRYVKHYRTDVAIPPALLDVHATGDTGPLQFFAESLDRAFEGYDHIVEALLDAGLPKKKAYEAARSVLPNATSVSMVVTGNIRCWTDVIQKRFHEAADAEIREFATQVLSHLRYLAPSCVQHIPNQPYS